MTLSDRLAEAARLRDAAANGRPVPAPAVVLPALEPEADPVEITIMLPPEGPVSIVERDRSAAPGSLCPTCNRSGELGIVDLHRQTTDWQCTTCGTMWRARSTAPAPRPLVDAGERMLPPMRG